MSFILHSRKTLLFTSLALVIGSCFSTAMIYYIGKKNEASQAQKQIDLIVENIKSENTSFYAGIEPGLKKTIRWGIDDVFAANKLNESAVKFASMIESISPVCAISVKDSGGNEFFIHCKENVWKYYAYQASSGAKKRIFTYNVKLGTLSFRDTSVLSEKREETAGSVMETPDSIVWHNFELVQKTDSIYAIPISLRFTSKSTGRHYTLTAYISLRNVLSHMKSLNRFPKSEMCLFSDEVHFDYSSPLQCSSPDLKNLRLLWSSSYNPVLCEALKNWHKTEASDSTLISRFEFNKTKNWVAFWPVHEKIFNSDFALIIPSETLLLPHTGTKLLFFIISLIILVASAVLFSVLLINYLRPDKKLKELTPEDVLERISQGESNTLEFKSTVRMNLATGKAGKEIELAWLKSVVAFCNTEGGLILIGVKDDGQVLGIDADEFQNDDKCMLHIQNLIKDHVGLEYVHYIKYGLLAVKDLKIVTVQCLPSPEPLFLKSPNKEQFYIRSGPASIELQASKILEYTKNYKVRNKK